MFFTKADHKELVVSVCSLQSEVTLTVCGLQRLDL